MDNLLYDELKNIATVKLDAGWPFPQPDVLRYRNLSDADYRDPTRQPAGHLGSTTGYAGWKFDKTTFRNRINRLAADLPGLMKQLDADFIVVRGTSGSYAAAALQMLIDVPMMLLRKRGEQSHGQPAECGTVHHHRGLILDDLIGGGDTVRGIKADMPHGSYAVGVMLHQYAENYSRFLRVDSYETNKVGMTVWAYE